MSHKLLALALKPGFHAFREGLGFTTIIHESDPETALIQWSGMPEGLVTLYPTFLAPRDYYTPEQLRAFYDANPDRKCPFDFDSDVPMVLQDKDEVLRRFQKPVADAFEYLPEGKSGPSLFIGRESSGFRDVEDREVIRMRAAHDLRESIELTMELPIETMRAAGQALLALADRFEARQKVNASVDKTPASK